MKQHILTTTMKRKLIFLAYGFGLVVIWAICFLSYKQSNNYSVVIGMSFTPISAYFLQKEYNFNLSILDKILILTLPLVYIIALYFSLMNDGVTRVNNNMYYLLFYIHLVNPLNIALLLLSLGLTKMKDISKPVNIFLFSYLIIFYVLFFYDDWKKIEFASLTENFDTNGSDSSKIKKAEINYNVNLSNFTFINKDIDTINLVDSSDKYIIIETWNETCLPCIKAMKELPNFYRDVQSKARSYYLYENDKESIRKKFDNIFNYRNIKEKTKILIDVDQGLYKALDMHGYPYFLLFDKSGKLIYHHIGYFEKEELVKNLMAHIQ